MLNLRARFHQISLVFAIALFIFTLQSLLPMVFAGKEMIPRRIITVSVYGVSFFAFMLMLFMRESPAAHLFQIGTMIVFGSFVTIFVTPREIGGDLVYVAAATLAYKYGHLRTRTLPKLIGIFGTLIATRLYLVLIRETLLFRHAVGQFVIATAMIPMLYWLFEDEFLRTAREKRRLEKLSRENQPFVEFGRNVSGVVHDFKNDLALFSMFAQLLEMNRDAPVTGEQITSYKSYIQRLEDRIERILKVTRLSREDGVQSFDLIPLLDSTMYVFQSNLAFRRTVRFEIGFPENPVVIRSVPAEIVSIVENVIRNSCEAMVEKWGTRDAALSEGVLKILCIEQDAAVSLQITDNGPGITGCFGCGDQNCFDCQSFQLGTTTKADGTGIGLLNVRNAARRIGASVVMKNNMTGGVCTEITIPKEPDVDG